MGPVAIPKTIDDPIHLMLWNADEIVPFMVCMLTGILIDQFFPILAIGAFAVKFYRHFRYRNLFKNAKYGIKWGSVLLK